MTYELFLEKALELFGEKGYAATTVDDIASAAGSTRTTFYLHFPRRPSVMSALLRRSTRSSPRPTTRTLTEVVAVRLARADQACSTASSPSGTRSSPT